MSMFEQAFLVMCAAAIIAALTVAYWYRPRPVLVAESLFGPTQAEYERELHTRDMEVFELRKQLERAHLLVDPLKQELEERSSERLAVVLQLDLERKRRQKVVHTLEWNRARVRNLRPLRADNVINIRGRAA